MYLECYIAPTHERDNCSALRRLTDIPAATRAVLHLVVRRAMNEFFTSELVRWRSVPLNTEAGTPKSLFSKASPNPNDISTQTATSNHSNNNLRKFVTKHISADANTIQLKRNSLLKTQIKLYETNIQDMTHRMRYTVLNLYQHPVAVTGPQ